MEEGEKESADEALPPPGIRFLQCEASAYFGMGLDAFLRVDRYRQAEMVAHVIVKNTRDAYRAEKMRKRMKASAKPEEGRKGMNPLEMQKRAWKIG